MTVASNWTIAKDTLSFVGGLMAAFPWFLDFWARLDLAKFKSIRTSMRSFSTTVAHKEAWVASPKPRDLLLTSLGLLLVCASFAIALLQSLGWLPTDVAMASG